MLGFLCTQKSTLWSWCNRWPSPAVSITVLCPSPLRPLLVWRRKGLVKLCYTLFNIESSCVVAQSFDFCLTFFWQLALPRCGTIYDLRFYFAHSFVLSIGKVSLWVMRFYVENPYFSCAFDVCYKTSACKWHFPILSRRIAWERNDFFKAKRKIWENVPKNVSSFVNLHVKYVYAFQGNLALFEISFWPSFDLKLF